MTEVKNIGEAFEARVRSSGFHVLTSSPPDQHNMVSVTFVDEISDRVQYAFQTDGQLFRLVVDGFEFLEFEYDEMHDLELAFQLLEVGKAFSEGRFRRDSRGGVEIVVEGRFFGGQAI